MFITLGVITFETYKHFWLETISLLHLALLHLSLSATPNVITPNVINIAYYVWRCITLQVVTSRFGPFTCIQVYLLARSHRPMSTGLVLAWKRCMLVLHESCCCFHCFAVQLVPTLE